jgi:hypothetical protein
MRRLTRFPSTFAIFILIVLLLVTNSIDSGNRSSYSAEHPMVSLLTDRAMGPEYDSLSAFRYKKIRDSIKQQIQSENMNLTGHGSGWTVYSFGTSSYGKEGKEDHYLKFSGYWSEIGPTAFYHEGGKTYMEYVDDSSFLKRKETTTVYISEKDGSDGKVLIPVSASTMKVLNIFHIVFLAVLLIAGFYILLATPLRILFNIAKGNVFSDENIGGLHAMAWMLIVIGILPGLVSVISYWVLHPRIPETVGFNYWESLTRGASLIIAGLCFLLLGKAFLKGSQLQEEQKLTI